MDFYPSMTPAIGGLNYGHFAGKRIRLDMKYPTVFHLIASISRDRDAPCVLIGGFAVNHYKVSRQTADLDFLIMAEDFKKIVKLLEAEGYEENYSQEVFSRLITNSDYLLDLDFMFVDGETLSKIIKKGKEIEIAGQKFIVPSLDHLIALKLHSIKHNPGLRKEKDLSDIIELIKANEVDIGSNDFKDICLKYGTRELYEEILKKV